MSIALTFENKSTALPLSLEGRGHSETWNDADYSLDQATGTWDVPGTILTEESKNNLSLTLETKT